MFTDKSQMGRSRPYRRPAPGGRRSPQKPGMTPDYSTITGQAVEVAPPAKSKVRPISQYGTAQEIMGVFKPGPDGWDAGDFEQAPPSYQEQRKANPAALTPVRPVPGFALGESSGTDLAALTEAGKQGE